MSEKNELTEKLKLLETEIHEAKSDLQNIDRKLQIAYSYEDELAQRVATARLKTEEIKKEFFVKHRDLMDKYDDVKKIVDVWTGNFYKH